MKSPAVNSIDSGVTSFTQRSGCESFASASFFILAQDLADVEQGRKQFWIKTASRKQIAFGQH